MLAITLLWSFVLPTEFDKTPETVLSEEPSIGFHDVDCYFCSTLQEVFHFLGYFFMPPTFHPDFSRL